MTEAKHVSNLNGECSVGECSDKGAGQGRAGQGSAGSMVKLVMCSYCRTIFHVTQYR